MEAEVLVLDSLMAEGEEGGGTTELPAGTEPGGDGGEENLGSGETTETPGDQEPGKGGDDKQDGRNNPDAIRKHLAQLKANPETAGTAKAITDRLGKARGYEAEFPTVKEAREVKQLLQSVGGREAVTAAIESHGTMQRMDALLEVGSPELVEHLMKQSPEGTVKMAGPLLDAIAKAKPEAFKAMMVPHAVAMMNSDGMPGALNALVDAFNSDNKDAMKDVLGRIMQYYGNLMKGAKPAGKDPDREAFEKEKTDFETAKQTEAIKATFNSHLEYSAGKIDAGLKDDIKRLGLGPKAVEKLRNDVWKEIESKRNADATFKNLSKTKFNGKTPKADAVTFLNGYTDTLVKDAIDEVVTTYYGARKAAAAGTKKVDVTAAKKPVTPGSGNGGGGGAGAPLKVQSPPDRKDIDYDDPRTDPLNGKAVRKSDKRLVTWR